MKVIVIGCPGSGIDYDLVEFVNNFEYNIRPNIIELFKKCKDKK